MAFCPINPQTRLAVRPTAFSNEGTRLLKHLQTSLLSLNDVRLRHEHKQAEEPLTKPVVMPYLARMVAPSITFFTAVIGMLRREWKQC